jgi:RimJ/RimL family protein N-acetyltransferase
MSTPEVTLAPWSLDAARRLVQGAPTAGDAVDWHPDYPLPDTVDALSMLLGAHEVDGPLRRRPRWWVHQIRVAGEVVGDVGFHGPPLADGPVVVEVGYAVVPPLRGRGVASRALDLLLALAWRDGAVQVLAETDAANLASRAVLGHAGFRRRLSGDFVLDRPAGLQVPA